MNSEWIDSDTGVNALSAIQVVGGEIMVDEIALKEKVWRMLNNIAMNGGSLNDYTETVYDEEAINLPNIPIYRGGLSKELTFDAVISTAQTVDQPRGTLGGRGTMTQGRNGGRVTIKARETCFIMGISSFTPRLDYSQGNRWYNNLKTLDDYHKPPLDIS